LLLVNPVPALAQAVDWQLTWQDDGSILETVTLEKMDLEMGEGEWETSTDNQGNLVLTRTTADWTSYTQKADRLPLRIENRNYLILESAFIYGEDYSADQKGLYYQIAIVPDAQLSIKLPGFIRAHTADSIIDSQEAVWQLSRLDEMATGELLLKATVFHGLVVGVILVVGAVIIIGLLFLRSIRRVHKLIEEEYSLENLAMEGVDDSFTETEEQKE
jgi:hypothetical protein